MRAPAKTIPDHRQEARLQKVCSKSAPRLLGSADTHDHRDHSSIAASARDVGSTASSVTPFRIRPPTPHRNLAVSKDEEQIVNHDDAANDRTGKSVMHFI